MYIGTTLNWFCTIKTITATQIQCWTPAISSAYTAGTPVTVSVSTRLVLPSKCSGTCQFTYNDGASSPSLTASSLSYVSTTSTATITLTGTGLLDSSNNGNVYLRHSVTGADT